MQSTKMSPVRQIEWEMQRVSDVSSALMSQFDAWVQKAHEKEEDKTVEGLGE